MARKPDYRKKDHIAKVSTELFAIQGYQSTTIEQIASVSGYAVGTLYLYFDSKEEILATILTDFVEYFVDNKLPELDKVKDPADYFKGIIRIFLTATEEYPERAWVLATELKKVIRPDSIIYKSEMGKIHSIIGDAIKKLKDAKMVKANIDIDLYTVIVYGVIESLSLHWISDKDKFALAKSDALLSDLLLNGLPAKKK